MCAAVLKGTSMVGTCAHISVFDVDTTGPIAASIRHVHGVAPIASSAPNAETPTSLASLYVQVIIVVARLSCFEVLGGPACMVSLFPRSCDHALLFDVGVQSKSPPNRAPVSHTQHANKTKGVMRFAGRDM